MGLATKQVDCVTAFVHAPINKDPNWDNLTPEEQEHSGVFVEMPQGYTEPQKVLKLKKTVCGLKQGPQNFFTHLKSKLEDAGFASQDDADPCLFASDKVMCLVHVDDTLFFSPKQEHITKAMERLRASDLAMEVEDSVARFLGVHVEHDTNNGTVKLTQRVSQNAS